MQDAVARGARDQGWQGQGADATVGCGGHVHDGNADFVRVQPRKEGPGVWTGDEGAQSGDFEGAVGDRGEECGGGGGDECGDCGCAVGGAC